MSNVHCSIIDAFCLISVINIYNTLLQNVPRQIGPPKETVTAVRRRHFARVHKEKEKNRPTIQGADSCE